MQKIIKKYKLYLILGLVSFIYIPSFTTFFSHDDFFHFVISQPQTLKEFINFFNPLINPQGWNYYRPLTTQIFYFIGTNIFNYSYIFMHVINFVFFVLLLLSIYKFFLKLNKNKESSFLGLFLYGVSATHFSRLYFLGAHQEIGLALYFTLAANFFVHYLLKNKLIHYWGSILFFILGLMSKETAVVLPAVLFLLFFYLKVKNKHNQKWTKTLVYLFPFILIDGLYIFLKLKTGLPQGDSYIWDFSPRILNTLSWYGLWALNIPEMFVDFIGPGLNINKRLFLWSPWVQIIITLFFIQLALLLKIVLGQFKKVKKTFAEIIFGSLWFLITLSPVLLLPWHKFTFYLTLPLMGLFFVLSRIIEYSRWKYLFLFIFFLTSSFTLILNYKTHWIVQGGKTAQRVKNYVDSNYTDLKETGQIVFYNTPNEQNSPWLPTENLKNALSNNNFFKVFYDGKIKAIYLKDPNKLEDYSGVKIKASKFIKR